MTPLIASDDTLDCLPHQDSARIPEAIKGVWEVGDGNVWHKADGVGCTEHVRSRVILSGTTPGERHQDKLGTYELCEGELVNDRVVPVHASAHHGASPLPTGARASSSTTACATSRWATRQGWCGSSRRTGTWASATKRRWARAGYRCSPRRHRPSLQCPSDASACKCSPRRHPPNAPQVRSLAPVPELISGVWSVWNSAERKWVEAPDLRIAPDESCTDDEPLEGARAVPGAIAPGAASTVPKALPIQPREGGVLAAASPASSALSACTSSSAALSTTLSTTLGAGLAAGMAGDGPCQLFLMHEAGMDVLRTARGRMLHERVMRTLEVLRAAGYLCWYGLITS